MTMTSQNLPRVDVVIPSYNYARYLEECAGSVLMQEGVDVRVLIIDDASKDNSPELAAELAKRDSRVEFRHHQANKGHIHTYNEGLEWASAPYYLLLNSDDVVMPGALARAAAVMEADSRVGLVYGRAFKGDPAAIPRAGQTHDDGVHRFSGTEFLAHMCSAGMNVVPTPTAVVRTAIEKMIGGYRPELPDTGDMELWMQIALHADVVFVKSCQAVYRWHAQNMSHQYIKGPLGDLPEQARTFDAVFTSDAGRKFAQSGDLRQIAARAMAHQALLMATRAFNERNMDRVQACLKFASEQFPAVRSERAFRTLQYKVRLGPRICEVIEPLLDGVRALRGGGRRSAQNGDQAQQLDLFQSFIYVSQNGSGGQ